MRVIISSGILVSGILLIRRAAKGKISRRLQYAIWITLPVLILLTPMISFDVAVPFFRGGSSTTATAVNRKPVIKEKSKIHEEGAAFADLVVASAIPVYNRMKIRTSYSERRDAANLKADALRIWNTVKHFVTALFIVFILAKNIVFAMRLKSLRLFYKKDSETGMNVYTVPDKSAPFLFIKDIYLNEENLNFERYMIIHEYCHYMHGDIFWNVLKYGFLAVYWFNPFIWLALYFINIDCELACDEAVIKFIGDENLHDYGMSLITLLSAGQKHSRFSIETSMRSRRSFIKERIRTLSISRKFSKIPVFIVCGLVFLLAGCSLIQPYEKEIEIKKEAGTNITYEVKSITAESAEQSYYNSIKKDGNTFYASLNNGLYRFNEKEYGGERISDGYFLLGNISDGYLYYLKDPDGGKNPGIGRFDLNTGEEQLLLPWADNELWFCNNVYAKGDTVYIEIKGQCMAYSINDGKAVKLDQQDNFFYNAVNHFNLYDEGAFVINHGYINSIDNYSKFTLSNSDKKELFICDTDTLMITKKEDCFGNVIICDKGVVYTKTNGDVAVCPLDEPDNEELLFSAADAGYTVDIRTYSENGLYALFNRDGDGYKCLRIDWQGSRGTTGEICEMYDTTLNADSGLSTFNDCTAYVKDDRFVINVLEPENKNEKTAYVF